ncbi:hypothetical protein EON79_08865 [bacterium]|nr:MAG: hypothetical protein EON79_08865 [bacterium]
MLRALLPLALFGLQAPAVTLAPVEGAKTVHLSSLKLNLGGIDATVDSEINAVYSKVTPEGFDVEETLANLKVMANGQELPANADPIKASIGKDGTLKTLGGGVKGVSAAMMYLIFRFVPAPAETGKTTTVTLKGDGVEIPDQKVESTYIGPKKVEAGEGFEFKQKTTANELVIDTDFVVKADGTILEATTKFTGLPVPQAGGSADGTGTRSLKP